MKHDFRTVTAVRVKAMGRVVLPLGALFLTSLGIVACGHDNAAVRVEGSAIARSAVTHWMSVVADEGSAAAGQPEPGVPVPPLYRACIAYRRRFPAAFGSAHLNAAELQHECSLEFQKDKLKALYFLISSDWVVGEGIALGVRVTRGEVVRKLAQLERAAPDRTAFRSFLVGTGGTTTDLLMRLEVAMLTARVQQKLEAEAQARHLSAEQRQEALRRFGTEFVKRWTARTDCHAGYVVPICRQYKRPAVAPALTPPQVPLSNLAAR
jgi:hypothetical protein